MSVTHTEQAGCIAVTTALDNARADVVTTQATLNERQAEASTTFSAMLLTPEGQVWERASRAKDEAWFAYKAAEGRLARLEAAHV